MTERDTHFQGFARLLWEEMLSQTQGYYIDVTAGHIPLHHPEDEEHKRYIDLIAQRAYDLVEHALLEVPPSLMLYQTQPEMALAIKNIPDLTEWPTAEPLPAAPTLAPPGQADAPASPPLPESS